MVPKIGAPVLHANAHHIGDGPFAAAAACPADQDIAIPGHVRVRNGPGQDLFKAFVREIHEKAGRGTVVRPGADLCEGRAAGEIEKHMPVRPAYPTARRGIATSPGLLRAKSLRRRRELTSHLLPVAINGKNGRHRRLIAE